jgi:hypothetical protein
MTTQEAKQAPAGLRVLYVSELCAMGEVDNCVAVVWRAQPTPESFRTRNTFLLDLAARAAGKCALVELIEANAKPPSQETRRVAMEVFKKLGPDLSAIGFVLEGSEMRSALIRAVLTGMMFFVKQLQPTKVFKRQEDMTSWVKPLVQPDNSNFHTELGAAFAHLRGLHGAATAP